MLKLVIKGVMRAKARFVCAAAGVAAAAGAVAFVFSLAATNAAQAPALAERAAAPWAAWQFDAKAHGADLELSAVAVTIDLRPGGRVLQGPPARAVVAKAPDGSPYSVAPLVEGHWVDGASQEPEVVCRKNALRRFGRGKCPEIGESVKFVGRKGTMTARIVGYLAECKLPRGFPDVFANDAAFGRLAAERHGTVSFWRSEPAGVDDVLTPCSESVAIAFKSDETRRMDYARPLMLIAAILTALALLVNSLLLSVEANRRQIAILRTIGAGRLSVVLFVAEEAALSALAGLLFGLVAAIAALKLYVTSDPSAFPVGMFLDFRAIAVAAFVAPVVAIVAVLFALRPALSVRPLDAISVRPRRRRHSMAIAFAFGFGAFVAVEVWGASLMRGFIPSLEWPDAIVSLLPSGASSFDVEKLRGLEGVERISELYPLQLDFAGQKDEPPTDRAPSRRGDPSGRRGRANALFLAAEWLPKFKFVEGSHAQCAEAIAKKGACVISLMISNARNLHAGDELAVETGRGPQKEVVKIPIAGVVDVNWHMVTSRGLLRGLNGASPMTDGPVFVSFDTVEGLDPRPSPSVRMTHLWVEYKRGFLAEHGAFKAGRIVEGGIAAALGNPDDLTVRLHARDEIADGTLAHGTDVIGQAARVPFVFLAILAIGFVAMLSAEADVRRREFAVLRAIGATRGQIAGRLCASALKTALLGIALAIPLGAAAGWYFSAGTARMWSGMPHYFVFPWQIVAEGAVGALVFALLVALPVAAFLARSRR